MLFLLTLALVLFTSYDKNDDPDNGESKPDPNAMILLLMSRKL